MNNLQIADIVSYKVNKVPYYSILIEKIDENEYVVSPTHTNGRYVRIDKKLLKKEKLNIDKKLRILREFDSTWFKNHKSIFLKTIREY